MTPRRETLRWLLAAAVAGVAAGTLLPTGTGSAWGSPLVELPWYADGLDSRTPVLQLAGNLGLLTAPAALAVLLWPRLGRPHRLVAVALAAGTTIEVLQWALPLGRVVSPLDAVLNAAGAVVAGLLVSSVVRVAGAWRPEVPATPANRAVLDR